MEKILLQTPTSSATIFVGDDALETRLPILTANGNNFVVADETVYRLYPDFFAKYFKNAEIFVLPSGEEYKSFSSLEKILQKMTEVGLLRTSTLFAVGGGVVGDIAGLCASLYMRGITCIQIPTTLLAQVDSSVGGKTAVDFNGVKNIIGAFYQPKEVLVAPRFLKTLPAREIKCGIGEIVKYCALNKDIFDKLYTAESYTDETFLVGLIADCIRHKAKVVEMDEKETGERKSLNVGHTTGHAIELFYSLSHGESVLYGMRFETKMAIENGVCETEYGEKLMKIIDKALALAPVNKVDFSNVEVWAQKTKADKKNIKLGEITLSVAKAKNEWTIWALPYETYLKALQKVVQ